MNDDHIIQIAEVFHLLGDPTRLRIAVACLDAARNVGEIAETVGGSPSLVSHHLRLLRGARMVRAERRGRQIYYTAADAHVRSIINAMIDHVAEPHDDEADGHV